MSTTSDIPSSGTYILNFAVMGWDGTLSNITTSTAVTFDDSTQFTVNGTDYTYDYTWGNDGSKQIILGNTKGGYYLLTNTDVDPSNYTYQNDSYGTDNHWQITENDGPSATLPFENRGFDPGAPAANGISARGIPSSGTYILNFAFMGWDGTLSSVMNSAPVTFDDTSHFTINGTQYTYDYTWGNNGSPQIILGNTTGGYYLLTNTDVDPSNYIYQNDSYGTDNHWQITGNDGTSSTLPFEYRGFDPCFLAGTEISMTGRRVKVENLTVGDLIDVRVNGRTEQRAVSWVGRSTCTVRPLLPDDQAGFPIRILKDAIMDGVPFKDMLITAEHCLFLGGCFVPARMLVNGRSIFYDRSFSSYDYYHVETETHAVIIADGVLTESYLDTGNRGSFRQAGTVLSLPRCRNLTWDDAAAPLNAARTFVEPLFRILSRRAENRGVAVRTAAPALTHEADIHLRTSTGLVLRPIRAKASPVAFMIPDGVETVYIVSNASRPCDVTGPFVDDRRRCGILVGNTTLFDSDTTRPITAHLRQADLPGWHGVEDGSVRWTSGNARLDLGAREPGHIGLLALQVLSSGPYVLETTTDEKIALQA